MAKNRGSCTTCETERFRNVWCLGMRKQFLLIVALVILGGLAVASGTSASASGTQWFNESGNYILAGGIQQMAFECGDHGANVLNNSTSRDTHIDIQIPIENTTGYCIGGQEALVPNDNNDVAIPNEAIITVEDEVATNAFGDPVGTKDTATYVAFYDFRSPPGHGDGHHTRLINDTFFCNSDTVPIPDEADKVRVLPDTDPVFAMADCGNAPTLDHAASFGTTGRIDINMST